MPQDALMSTPRVPETFPVRAKQRHGPVEHQAPARGPATEGGSATGDPQPVARTDERAS